MDKKKNGRRALLSLLLLLGTTQAMAVPKEQAQACEALRSLALDKTEIVAAEAVSGGYKISWKTLPVGIAGFSLPASCRITAIARPTQQSQIGFEVWLPVPDAWNGRLYGLGNGGLAGSVERFGLILALQRGYAAVSTDTGHVAAVDDGSWALGQPEKVIDFGHRAVHLMTVHAKALIAAYYGRPQQHAYFSGCSNGGRQALMSAQLHPEDYDGIIAGAPAIDAAGGLAAGAWMLQGLTQPGAFVSPKQLGLVHDAAIRACDALDGVEDGLIDDPRACPFDPAVLRCEDGEHCLNDAQVSALRRIYQGPQGDYAGRPYPSFSPGSESAWTDFTGKSPEKGGHHIRFLRAYMRYFVLQDPAWDLGAFDFERDHMKLESALGPEFSPVIPQLDRYAARGGKLIVYHGWNDQAISPGASIHYYEQVRARTHLSAADNFMQLYMVPGMAHCAGGEGFGFFGQYGPGGDPQRGINAAMERWVEQGDRPGPIVATQQKNMIKGLLRADPGPGLRSRPICPYPQKARWDGKGSIDEASSFSCR